MENRFYVIIVCLLSCSVLLLGLSYSKQSSNTIEKEIIETNTKNYRVVYSTEENLDTTKENEVRLTVINKKNSNTNYALYLNEINNDIHENVFYTIDGINYYALTDNIINLGTLNKYGTDGDTNIYTIKLRSSNTYNFDYYVDEDNFLNEVSYGS